MQRFKQTWLAVGRTCRWTLDFCISARCQRNALRRQRFARRNGSAYIFAA
jgi:hypothetical protein